MEIQVFFIFSVLAFFWSLIRVRLFSLITIIGPNLNWKSLSTVSHLSTIITSTRILIQFCEYLMVILTQVCFVFCGAKKATPSFTYFNSLYTWFIFPPLPSRVPLDRQEEDFSFIVAVSAQLSCFFKNLKLLVIMYFIWRYQCYWCALNYKTFSLACRCI